MSDTFPIAQSNSGPLHAKVLVHLGERSYPIHIGRNFASALPKWLQERCEKSRHAVVIIDENVNAFAERYCDVLRAYEYRVTKISVPSGESSKSLIEAARLWDEMLDAHTDRGSMVLAIGGGVVGDLAGFVAASFTRGLPLIQIPTTLLSHVDSSVGGKTAVNLPRAKNMIGAFWQPTLVVIDTESLVSLPQREFVSGLAEVVKYGMILLPDIIDYLEQNVDSVLNKDSVRSVISLQNRVKPKHQSSNAMNVKQPDCEQFSTMATPLPTHWKASSVMAHCSTAKRFPSACTWRHASLINSNASRSA